MRMCTVVVLLAGCWTSSPPPPQPARPAAPAPATEDLVQPVKVEPAGPDDRGDPGPPPPTATAQRQNVPPTQLEGYRIAGNKAIVPDDPTKLAIAQAGKPRLVGAWKLCVDVTGDIAEIKRLKTTGFPDYDRKIEQAMSAWRYRPFLMNGKPVPVCTAVTFIYSQSQPTPPPAP